MRMSRPWGFRALGDPGSSRGDRFAVAAPFLLVAVWAGIRSAELAAGNGIAATVPGRVGPWSAVWAAAAAAAFAAAVWPWSARVRLAAAAVVEVTVASWAVAAWTELGLSGAAVISNLVVIAVLVAQSWGRTPIRRRKAS